ncbi:FimV/HubP family polar landmark protein [Kingella denitrificans]|uniref:FimV/HubP family polar landmark protein n=1 Tax=Kingella denitrificans TaxID=502 RepID=UPI000B97E049|nr:FimV/HubP family polar landmark protein [Kingella denitrificans]
MKNKSKIISASLSLMTSMSAVAGLGGLNVQSNLGEPFSASIVVTGNEAQAVLQSGSVNVMGGNIHGTVVPQGNGNAIIRLRSNSVVNDPIVNFVVSAGNQTRQYTAMVNPAHYRPADAVQRTRRAPATRLKPIAQKPAATAVDTVDTIEADVPHNPTTAMQKTSPRPRYYRVQHGESVSSIAARYRPRGMSVQRAIRALIAANPRAFHHGRMYRNVTLYIPSAAQWHAYANTSSERRRAAHRLAAQRPSAPIENTATQVENNQPAPIVETPPAPPPANPAPVETQAKPVNNATEQQAAPVTQTPEPAPVEPSVPVKQEAPVVAPASEVQAASNAPGEMVAASDFASASETSAPAVEEVAPPPAPPAVETSPPAPVEEEGMDLMQMGLIGGAAALALGGAAYALSRRRKPNESGRDESEDEFEESEEEFEGSAPQEMWVNEEFTLPEDDTYENSSTKSASVHSQTTNDEFSLDTFEPEIDVTNPNAVADDEWLVDSQEAQTSSTAHDDFFDESLFAADTTAPSASVVEEEVHVAEPAPVVPAAVEEESSDDLDWLSEQFGGNETVEEAPVEEAPIVEETSFDDFDTDIKPAVEVAESTDTFNLDTPAEEDFAADFADNVIETPAAVEEPLDFSVLDQTEESFSTDLPEVAHEDALEFDLPSGDASLDVGVDHSVTQFADLGETHADTADLAMDMDFDNLDIAEAPAAPEVSAATPATEADFFADDLTIDTPAVEPAKDVSDLNSVETPAVQDAGFVSEAVGMTAPLEAKLELAKMYLEIDDAVAARETLRELVEESTGNLQQQAQQLLSELGG